MTIKVQYENFAVYVDAEAEAVKQMIARDASWGTYITPLTAAAETCGDGSHDRWIASAPRIRNGGDGSWNASAFGLEFPDDNFNFERESVDHFVGTVAGNIVLHHRLKPVDAGGGKVKLFEVADFTLPVDALKQFPGPSVGIDELYGQLLAKTIKGVARPIVAFTVKPRRGMSVTDIERLYKDAAAGGIDIVEDDERLIDSDTCPFAERLAAVAAIQKDVPTVYSMNITGDSIDAVKRLDACVQKGIKMVKIDVLVCGFEVLRRVAWRIQKHHKRPIAITCFPDVVGAFRRASRTFILRLARLCGADIIYAGSPTWDRYGATPGSTRAAVEPIFRSHEMLCETVDGGPHIRSTLATITNDQHPTRTEATAAAMRALKQHYKYGVFVGGGIAGFPDRVSTAARLTIDMLNHVSGANLDKYTNFDYGEFGDKMSNLGWHPLDVRSVLK